MLSPRTVAQAVEDAAKADPTRGFRFVPESFAPGLTSGVANETTFSYTAIERASARYGGALQALGLRKGDRVALILPQARTSSSASSAPSAPASFRSRSTRR
jgi:fatty-acyl-CoA synthase